LKSVERQIVTLRWTLVPKLMTDDSIVKLSN
jgi:hypothetical protein